MNTIFSSNYDDFFTSEMRLFEVEAVTFDGDIFRHEIEAETEDEALWQMQDLCPEADYIYIVSFVDA